MGEVRIAPLTDAPPVRAALARMLIEVVAGGGSVGFMHPLSGEDADRFWSRSLEAAARGERVVLGAFDGEGLIGTVTLQLTCPPNQPHRAEIAKMMTAVAHRGRGIASALLREAEAIAVSQRKTMLVLDTATEDGASALYERMGFIFAGELPDYAYKPYGGLTGSRLYWKRLSPAAPGR
jgi:ribosomal protein S18 acetylase RimI-like enzyme